MALEDIQKVALASSEPVDELEDALECAEDDLIVLSNHIPNITISLTDVDDSTEKEISSTSDVTTIKRLRGRPNKHPFAGRINLLKSEIDLALTNRDAFKVIMEEAHPLTVERYNALVLANQLSPVETLTFVFKGGIDHVLDSMHRVIELYEIQRGFPCEKRIHKERVVTDKNNENFIEPTYVLDVSGKKIFHQQDCFPNRIYGYVTVWFKDEQK